MIRSTFRLAISCAAIDLLVTLSDPASAATVRTVALSDQQAPGTPGGVNFDGFTAPVLNAAGQTAFLALLDGSGVNSGNEQGIWSEGSGSLELVARGGDLVPGTSGASFSGFLGPTVLSPIPLLSADGQTAFGAYLSGSQISGTANDRGIWAGGADNLRLVARQEHQAPDAPGGVNFSSFSVPVLNAAGQTAFQAFLKGSGVDSTNNFGIWSEGSGNLELVVRNGDPAPGTPDGVNFRHVGIPLLNGTGQTSFLARLTGSGVDQTNDLGLWAERSGSLELVARTGDDAPGTSSGVHYSEIGSHAFNNAGQTAFFGWLTGSGVDETNATGVWSEGSGTLSLIAREGDRAPGTPDGVFFNGREDINEPNDLVSAFSEPVLNAAGQTVFSAALIGAGVDNTNNAGIWLDGSGGLELVVRKGSQAPGMPDGANFTAMGDVVINAAGQIAFQGSVVGGHGIWATDSNGILQLVVRGGDALEVAPSDFRVIGQLCFVSQCGGHQSGNEDGRYSGFNDRGQIAFQAVFTDGSSGIFVSNAVAVPEPTSVMLAGALLFGMVFIRQRMQWRVLPRRRSADSMAKRP